MVFFGSLIGFFIIPFVADNLGRKIAMQVSWAICTLGVFLLVIANSEIMIGIGYFLAGFGSNPAITLCFSFINEQCLYKSRQRYGVFVQIFLALGESTIALMFIPKGSWGWRWVMIVLLLMVVVVNGFLFYLLETPKFLFNKSK
jgi:MFS family permease